MADKPISALYPADYIDVSDLFVVQQNNQAKSVSGQLLISELAEALDGHGGISSFELTGTAGRTKTYTITYADGSTQDINISDGEQGLQGVQTYVHIRYSAAYPVQTILTTPNNYIGIYAGTSATAPTNTAQYTWFLWKGQKGDTGVSITSITKASSSANVDTYVITFSDASTQNFTVTNGSNIQSISLSATSGLQDTYTVTLTDGTIGGTFIVTNARSIVSVERYSGTGLAGSTDVYHINYNDGTFDYFNVVNGLNGQGSVNSVSDIVADGNGDVPLVKIQSRAPTSGDGGYVNQLWFDSTNNALYVCTVASGSTYTWQSASVSITIDDQLSSSSTNPVQNKVINTELNGKVPTTRTVNGKALSSNITLSASDVGAVPTTRTVNGNALSSDVVTHLLFKSGTDYSAIATSAWTADSSYDGYNYKAVISLSGVTANMFPDVVFLPEDIASGNYAPVADSGAGSVTIYAKAVPDDPLTVPSIACFA